MAVVITSKFYQESEWKDISKIVFTSPNLSSPAVAGTRSHILPGEGNLGLWYEDTSYMYRIEALQESTNTDYYNFKFSTITDLDMASLPDTVTVTGTENSYEVFYDYIKDGVGCTPIGYIPLDMNSTVTEYRIKLEYSNSEANDTEDIGYLPNIFSTNVNTPGDVTRLVYGVSTNLDAGDTYNDAWVSSTIQGIDECYFEIDLDKPYKITKIFMRGQYCFDSSAGTYLNKRFFGNFIVYGRLNITDNWTTLYTGSNTSNIEKSIFISSNSGYYRYYKISILNNTGLTGVTTGYYALSALQFYIYDYNDIPTRNKAIYSFDNNGEADILYISDIDALGPNTYSIDVESANSVSGTITSGTEFRGWGTLGENTDFIVDNSIVFEVTTGEAYNCRLTAWDDVTHSTLLNELIQGDHVRASAVAYCCRNSKLSPNESYNPINYVFGPVHNKILKGNTVIGNTKYYYGDFDLVYRYQDDIYGDYLIFKPMLYNITDAISYGVYDFIITLHYSYT